MIVSAIVAATENHVIGLHNDIPWYLPADLKYFKKTTLGHAVIMGRHTYRSIGRPLPKRTNIILSRDPFLAVQGCLVAHSIEEALTLAADAGETEAFIIGGGAVYAAALPLLDRVYLTRVHTTLEGDTHFPVLEAHQWAQIAAEHHEADERNEYAYTFEQYHRREEA